MNPTLQQELRRKAPLSLFLLPQLAVLGLFLATHYGELALAWANSSGLWDFFVSAVSVGIGWPLLSIAVLACSLLWREECIDVFLREQLVEGLPSFKASELAVAFDLHDARARRLTRVAWCLGSGAFVVFAGSIVGALMSSFDNHYVSLSATLTVVAWFFFAIVRGEMTDSFESLTNQALYKWGMADGVNRALKSAKEEGRVDHPVVEAAVTRQENWVREQIARQNAAKPA